MADTSGANLELAMMLPLGVIANQLLKIEAELRFLNMKVVSYAEQREGTGLHGQIASRLENINEALDRIRGLMSDLQSDIQPDIAPRAGRLASPATRKAPPERDD
jgi:hypothetical protein